VSLKTLIRRWEETTKGLPGFNKIQFMKSRWGSDSGSPIEFEVQENDDRLRREIVESVREILSKHPSLSNVEVERPVTRNEYKLHLKREKIFELGIIPQDVAQDLRSFIEGQILYTLNKGEEEVDVRLTSRKSDKVDVNQILSLRTPNKESYLVPYRQLVDVVQEQAPANIQRINYKRTTKIYADIKENSKSTPLDIAEHLESHVFPQVMEKTPSAHFQFRGEIEDSRESQGDFSFAILLSLGLIYILLVLLYNSLSLPFLIGAIIPFGVVGVIFSFYAHGMTQYGFFAVIGTLGMIGVVVNDAIVMISKLEENKKLILESSSRLSEIAIIASTRLRAVVLTTLTTVAGLFPTAYGWAGYDSMLAEMMLAMGWGLIFSTCITLVLVPCLYSMYLTAFSWRQANS
jgi:multidrug efflux pump subunit AcrB